MDNNLAMKIEGVLPNTPIPEEIKTTVDSQHGVAYLWCIMDDEQQADQFMRAVNGSYFTCAAQHVVSFNIDIH